MSNDATPAKVRLTDGLGAGAEAGRLTHAELADAIERAWQMQHRTGRMSANHGDITAHLAALLKEQRRRAESA